jgi:hypothetical protein
MLLPQVAGRRAQTAQPERSQMRRWSKDRRRISVVEGSVAASFGAGLGDRFTFNEPPHVVRSARLSGGRPTVSILTCQSDLNRSWQVNEKAKAGLKSKGRALNFIPIGETDEAEHK